MADRYEWLIVYWTKSIVTSRRDTTASWRFWQNQLTTKNKPWTKLSGIKTSPQAWRGHLRSIQWSRAGRWKGGQMWRRGRKCGEHPRWPSSQLEGWAGSRETGGTERSVSTTHSGKRWQGGFPQSRRCPLHLAWPPMGMTHQITV